MDEITKTKELCIFLLHGITKSKEEFSKIKSTLLDLNFYVETPNLPKHELCPKEFRSC
jgi:esterase/lipase